MNASSDIKVMQYGRPWSVTYDVIEWMESMAKTYGTDPEGMTEDIAKVFEEISHED